MVDVAVSTQLQQWTFDKPALTRPERTSSAASSPDLYHTDPDTLRINTAVVEEAAPQSLEKRESVALQERYMSSEEDLSPMEGSGSDTEYDDDDVVIYELEKEVYSARKMSVQPLERGKSPDMAVMVSYMSVGRPKVIELANAGAREPNQRSASLAQLPISTINKLRKAELPSRRSLAVSPQMLSRASSPALSVESRRPSTGHANTHAHAASNAQPVHSSSASFQTASSTRSPSPTSTTDIPTRPTTASAFRPLTRSRTSIFFGSSKSNLHSPATTTTPFPPLTPISPDSHSFLSSDPYENSTTNAASPIIKPGPHKRLRSISQKLTLAKLAISSPTTKKRDSRISSRPGNMPPTPATPYTPLTPLTAPPMTTTHPSPMKSRRESRISRPTTARNSQDAIATAPLSNPYSLKRSNTRMVARGAGDREPPIEIPPCPEDLDLDPRSSIKARRLKKRKSLMDLL